MHRPAQRLTRVLACAAAVPVMLIVSGCSSDSGSGKSDDRGGGSPSAGSSPSVRKAAYGTLPEPCETVSKKTLDDLVPKAGSGRTGSSDNVSLRGTCSWSSLDNNGVKGSQFRWLNVSLQRFESDATRGSGNKLAATYFDHQVADARATEGATGATTDPVTGTGDQASAVHYQLKKKEGTFQQQTVVARVENVVVTVDYNGAGLAGEKTPSAADLLKDAKKAADEAVAAVTAANDGSGAGSSADPGASSKAPGSSKHSPSPKPSKTSESSEDAKDSKDSKDAKDSKDRKDSGGSGGSGGSGAKPAHSSEPKDSEPPESAEPSASTTS